MKASAAVLRASASRCFRPADRAPEEAKSSPRKASGELCQGRPAAVRRGAARLRALLRLAETQHRRRRPRPNSRPRAPSAPPGVRRFSVR